MILYQLACVAEHRFETWFRHSEAYDDQVERGLLSCPVCGSGQVTKSIMAPAVVVGSGKRVPADMPPQNMLVPTGPPQFPAADPATGPLLDDRHRAIRAAMRAVRDKILSEGQNVGPRFPEEARSMHEGAIPVRPIHGQATRDEAKSLIEDGIMILPVPVVPEELN